MSLMKSGSSIELGFDEGTEARFHALWTKLRDAGIQPQIAEVGGRPHLSLAVFERIDPDENYNTLRAFAECCPPMTIRLSAVGTFPGDTGIVFLSPVVTPELLALHERLHKRLDAAGTPSMDYYRPGRWIPHCSVALDVPDSKLSLAIDLSRKSDVFGEATLTDISLVSFHPAREWYTFDLTGEG